MRIALATAEQSLNETAPCAECGRGILAGDPAYVFRGATYHDWCIRDLQAAAAETEAALRRSYAEQPPFE